jgi:hypothetical protein
LHSGCLQRAASTMNSGCTAAGFCGMATAKQIGVYCGVTVGISCHQIMREVINEREVPT